MQYTDVHESYCDARISATIYGQENDYNTIFCI